MVVVWILTYILQSQGVADAVTLWHWFGQHELLTILLLIFLG
jgi:hypothetical protein